MPSREDLIAPAELLVVAVLLLTALLTPGAQRAKPSVAAAAAAPAAQASATMSPATLAQARIPPPAKPAVKVADASPAPRQALTESHLAPPLALAEPSDARPAASPAPPPAAAATASTDIPDLGPDYRKARRILLNKGFKPTRVAPPECRGPEPSVDACWGALVQYPEIEACSGGLKGSCTGWWLAPDDRVLKIQTQGDSARIRDRHWASPGEVDELPKGWKP